MDDVAIAGLARVQRRPARDHLADAERAVAGISEPAVAWDALARRGLIPAAWVDDPRRRFRVAARLARGSLAHIEPDAGYATAPFPPTVRLAVLLAADAANVPTAEALAHEHRRRAWPWRTTGIAEGEPAPEGGVAIWRMVGAAAEARYGFDDTSLPMRWALLALRTPPVIRVATARDVVAEAWPGVAPPGSYGWERPWGPNGLAVLIAASALWRRATAAGAVVPARWSYHPDDHGLLRGAPLETATQPPAFVGRRIADWPDPYEPLLALAALGYELRRCWDASVVLGTGDARATTSG